MMRKEMLTIPYVSISNNFVKKGVEVAFYTVKAVWVCFSANERKRSQCTA